MMHFGKIILALESLKLRYFMQATHIYETVLVIYIAVTNCNKLQFTREPRIEARWT